jgi:hypothetical protein
MNNCMSRSLKFKKIKNLRKGWRKGPYGKFYKKFPSGDKSASILPKSTSKKLPSSSIFPKKR